MNHILLHRSYGYTSMKWVLDRMEEDCSLLVKYNTGEWFEVGKDLELNQLDSVRAKMRGNNVINWGNRIFGDDSLFVLNKPSGIANASNKRLSRMLLQDAGINVPKTRLLSEEGFWDFPLVARPPQHHGGNHFHILKSAFDLATLMKVKGEDELESWYFSAVFEKDAEYRVHVASGKVLIVHEKPAPENPDEIRWNHVVNHESWRALKWSEQTPEVNQEAIKAVAVLGLDYAAVDIMVNSKKGEVAICEVNTSPSVNTEYSSGKYAAYFDWAIRHNFPEPENLGGKSIFYNNLLRE